MTVAGLEVTHLKYIGLPQETVPGVHLPKSDHLVWDREKLLLGRIVEVRKRIPMRTGWCWLWSIMARPNWNSALRARRIYSNIRIRARSIRPSGARSRWKGRRSGMAKATSGKRMTLKGRELRGIYNKSMVCSEKELGIADEHEGVIVMEDDASLVAGMPLADVLGDVVLDIEFTPNLARCLSMIGVAREVAAILDVKMKYPDFGFQAEGAPIEGQVDLDIREPALNPRFTLTLLRDTEVRPSPFWMQHRLKLIGQRPRNNIVDVTNYLTFELGQPTHAFDYDKLVARAGGRPTIITRLPEPGEALETLDAVVRELGEETILVADSAGALSLGGVIGGGETEISEATVNVLLEAAAWDNIGIRKTIKDQRVHTEASARFQPRRASIAGDPGQHARHRIDAAAWRRHGRARPA